ncbi:MAG: DUF4824 family protein [Anaeromyxobacter sp.]
MRRHGWKLAVALVLLVTGWVLAGAAWNRSATEAEVVLTERELPLAPVFLRAESSGVALRIETTAVAPRPAPRRLAGDHRRAAAAGHRLRRVAPT